MKHTGAFLALALALALADQLSKFWVFGVLPQGASVPWIPGVLACTPQLNPGVAFGLFGGHPWIVRAFTLVLAVVLWFWYRQAREHGSSLLLVGLALILSGALGNLIDRLCVPPYQVRDFLDFLPTLPLVGKWPVFNIADSCICIGVALVFIAELVQAPPEETGARGDASPDQNPPNATT